MPMNGLVPIAAAIAAALLVLTAGCTSDPAPALTATADAGVTATPSTSPTATPTPDVMTTPARPEAMATPSDEGAAAAAGYFISLYPYARATGDLSQWSELSGAECTFCASVTEEVSTLIGQGRSVVGGDISIESADGTTVIANESYSADIVFTEAPTEIRKDTTLVSTGEGGRISALVVLRWTGQAWEIRALDASPAA